MDRGNHYEAAFEAYLQWHRHCYVAVDETRRPILGEAPGLPGFFNAVSANGYTLGPIIGRITADAIRGEPVNLYYRLERFGQA